MLRFARPFIVLVFIAVTAFYGGDADASARNDPNKSKRGKVKEEYKTTTFAVRPMIVPLFGEDGMRQQYIIRFDIILNDGNDRQGVYNMLPRIRNEAYQVLLHVITFRTLEPRIPPKSQLEAYLLAAVRKAIGGEKVKAVRLMMSQPGELPARVR